MNIPETKAIAIGAIHIGGNHPLVMIAGPCVVENREMILQTAKIIRSIADRYQIPFIFKSSYRKANRTSGNSFASIGDEKALQILAEVKREFGVPILTDIHSPAEATRAAEVADVLQIPAFLCRQTELLEAAGGTGRVVNIKKGQFVAPEDMHLAAEKVAATGNNKILLTERGTTFGYHNLVVDIRSLPIMRKSGYPVVLDVTHSVQLPGGAMNQSGGQPEFIFPIARAGVAAGCDALFIETHPNPAEAYSDAASQLKLDMLEELVKQVKAIDEVVKRY
ncbi:MAG: 3-deoxy-8-phosphooctulonate synthase [Ignavibacteriales bacterium]|nr:3-deoxy-8-phosphooctulonate synthase [Ignavibacteriales bacterium]